MQTDIRILPDGAADTIICEMGGTDAGIPILYVGRLGAPDMAAWLRRLAEVSENLAEQIEANADSQTVSR